MLAPQNLFCLFCLGCFFSNLELLCSKGSGVQPESLSPKQPASEEGYRLQQINPLLLLFQSAHWLVLANYMSRSKGKQLSLDFFGSHD